MKTQLMATLLFCFTLTSQTGLSSEITDVFKSKLPEKLSLLNLGDSISHTKQILGRPDTEDGRDNFFYNLTGRDYDTTVGFTNGSVRYILYKFGADQITLEEVKKLLPKDTLANAEKRNSPTKPDEESYYSLDLLDQGLRIEILNDDKQTIRSVLKWQPGESAP